MFFSHLDLLEAVDPEVLQTLKDGGEDDDVIKADDTMAALDDLEGKHREICCWFDSSMKSK